MKITIFVKNSNLMTIWQNYIYFCRISISFYAIRFLAICRKKGYNYDIKTVDWRKHHEKERQKNISFDRRRSRM